MGTSPSLRLRRNPLRVEATLERAVYWAKLQIRVLELPAASDQLSKSSCSEELDVQS
jgi:hypothetical protein